MKKDWAASEGEKPDTKVAAILGKGWQEHHDLREDGKIAPTRIRMFAASQVDDLVSVFAAAGVELKTGAIGTPHSHLRETSTTDNKRLAVVDKVDFEKACTHHSIDPAQIVKG